MNNRLLLAVALVASLLPASLTAQRGPAAVTNVSIAGVGTSATVTWTPVASKGITYRVLRALDARAPGVDITRPVDAASVVDPNVVPGTTYFYQVIAVYGDGTSAPAAPVGFTVPSIGVEGQPLGPAATRSPPPPTVVTGIVVNGNTASAIVTWQPVAGATSYTIKRSKPDDVTCCTASIPGLTTPTWTDPGPGSIGFAAPGAYLYEVTAFLAGGTTASGQAGWTRPSPSCAPPLPNQAMLSVLDPWGPNPQLTLSGPYPSGAIFNWPTVKNKFIAYRMERSVQGTNAWTLAATSCGGASPIVEGMGKNLIWHVAFMDALGGVVPNTTYLYRVTAFAANGEAGQNTVAWTAPGQVVLRWLSATIVGSSVTLNVRYEPPATNAPVTPTSFRVIAPNGLSLAPTGGSCASLAGCSVVFNGVPKGTHSFTVRAEWTHGPPSSAVVLEKMSADTTVFVP